MKVCIFNGNMSRGGGTERITQLLADALVEEKLVTYAEDGMYLTIAGVTTDFAKDQSWWNIKKDGTALTQGMNTQPIADGEHYEATYTIGF